jgi:hypothetical protein
MPRNETVYIFSFFRLTIDLLRSNDDAKSKDIAKGQGLCVS